MSQYRAFVRYTIEVCTTTVIDDGDDPAVDVERIAHERAEAKQQVFQVHLAEQEAFSTLVQERPYISEFAIYREKPDA